MAFLSTFEADQYPFFPYRETKQQHTDEHREKSAQTGMIKISASVPGTPLPSAKEPNSIIFRIIEITVKLWSLTELSASWVDLTSEMNIWTEGSWVTGATRT